MAKYSKKIVKQITDLIETDSYTIAEICRIVGINKDTFYDWLKKKSDFSDQIDKAKGEYDDFIVVEAKRSLVKKIQGYSVEEKKTVTVDTGKKDPDTEKPIVKVKEHSVTVKHIQPDTKAIIFTLTNKDPDNWKNRVDNSVSADITLKSELEKLSDKELKNIIKNGDAKASSDEET